MAAIPGPSLSNLSLASQARLARGIIPPYDIWSYEQLLDFSRCFDDTAYLPPHRLRSCQLYCYYPEKALHWSNATWQEKLAPVLASYRKSFPEDDALLKEVTCFRSNPQTYQPIPAVPIWKMEEYFRITPESDTLEGLQKGYLKLSPAPKALGRYSNILLLDKLMKESYRPDLVRRRWIRGAATAGHLPLLFQYEDVEERWSRSDSAWSGRGWQA